MSDCCFGDPLLTLSTAVDRALSTVCAIRETETVPLLDAYGRVLAGDLLARLEVPPHDNSAMDGFALYCADLQADRTTRLPVVGNALAGHPYSGPLTTGAAVRITTGGVIPDGPDAVIMQEHCRIAEDESWIEIDPQTAVRIKPGENIRRRGEDVRAGLTLLAGGLRLRPQDVALAAGQGITTLEVVRRARVAVASTGDELYAPGETLPPDAIYESNRYALIGLLRNLGCVVTDLGILRDERDTLLQVLKDAAATQDVILTSGGVSVGTADLIKEAILALGSLEFWRLAIKPGKPVALGRIDDCLIVGLPGNPVSVMIAFLMLARPLLLKLMGATLTALPRLSALADFSFHRKPGRREWLRARLHFDQAQQPVARIYHTNSSGALSSLSWADGLVELPEDCASVRPGDTVNYLLFNCAGVE